MNTNDNNPYYWSSFDIGLSATLLCLGFTLHSLDKENPHKVKFIFRRTQELDDTIHGYWAKALQVEPQSLLTNLKFLKNRLYSDEPDGVNTLGGGDENGDR